MAAAILRQSWCPYRPSPNYTHRHGRKPEAIVVHYTGGGGLHATARWLCRADTRRSYHILIGRSGQAVQLVPLDRAAMHAAGSFVCSSERYANSRTIGLAFCNVGPMVRIDGSFFYRCDGELVPYEGARAVRAEHLLHEADGYWEKYPFAQIAAAKRILAHLRHTGWSLPLVGHDEVARPIGCKLDPGPAFPWAEFDVVP